MEFVRSTALKRCIKCSQKYYCGKVCQTADWHAGHKHTECKILASPAGKLFLGRARLRFLLRYLVKLKFEAGFNEKEYDLADGRKVTVQDLSTLKPVHPNFMMNHILSIPFVNLKLVANAGEFQIRLAQTDNCFDMTPTRRLGIEILMTEGCCTGIYMETLFFKHSCRPNVCRTSNGLKIQVRAIDYIDTDHQEFSIKMINDLAHPVSVRQEEYYRISHVYCKCSRCLEEDEDVTFYMEIMRLNNVRDNAKEMKEYRQLYDAAKQLVVMAKKILGPFSRNGSEMLLLMISSVVAHHGKTRRWFLDKRQIDELLKDLDESMAVMYGHDHPFSEQVCTMVQNVRHSSNRRK